MVDQNMQENAYNLAKNAQNSVFMLIGGAKDAEWFCD
jgi:hypothetical protein